jgi:hypothetical protein
MPYALILTVAWSVMKFINLNTSFDGVGAVLVGLTFAAILAEFYKSSDIGVSAFGIDTGCSVLQVIVATITFTQKIDYIFLPDILLGVAILADAWFSPFNSFKTALRNFGGGSDHHH